MARSFKPTEKLNVDWDFVTKYLPDYDHRDDVHLSDRLSVYINEKGNMEADERKSLLEEYGTRKNIVKASETLDRDLMCEAVNHYLETVYKKKTYFLFGGELNKIYFNSDFSEVLTAIENNADYALFTYIEGETSIFDLLYAADGYGGYTGITESEYNQIRELEKTI